MKKGVRIALISALSLLLAFVIVFWVTIPLITAGSAKSYFSVGKINEGISSMERLNNFPYNSPIKSLFKDSAYKAVGKVKVGESVYLGRYEQDGNEENGKEPIEWIVLHKEGGKALLISKYVLDIKSYSKYTSRFEMHWDVCFIRKWLGETFYNDYFTADEKKIIIETENENKVPESSAAKDGEKTLDKAFLLSIEEVEKYLPEELRKTVATRYAKNRGEYVESKDGNCMWWLRTLGRKPEFTSFVYTDGKIMSHGMDGKNQSVGMRPSLWIEM
jgi:hypothetical protein